MKKLVIFLLIAAPFVLNAQMTYVPDDNFEQALIDKGLDSGPLNDSVPTNNIDKVTILDVLSKNIYDLTGIEDFTALEILNCYDNNIEHLNLGKNINLQSITCHNNKIETLTLDTHPNLYDIYCNNNRLTSLDISKSLGLRGLFCDSNNIRNLDFSKHIYFYRLSCVGNRLDYLNIKNGSNDFMGIQGVGHLDVRDNPDLLCIQVDDSILSKNYDGWYKDSTAHYSTDCGYTAINDFKFENKSVSISPNPASDFIEINLTDRGVNPSVNDDVKIFNFLGEMVSGLDTPPNPLFLEGGKMRLDVSGLAPGVYFVRLGDSVQRFVKY